MGSSVLMLIITSISRRHIRVTMTKRYSGAGGRLKWLRKHGPLARFNTVKEMCKHLNLKNSTWYDWISDKYYPKEPIITWLEHEGVDLKWLETGRGYPYVINPTPNSRVGSSIKADLGQPAGRQKKLPGENQAYRGIYYVSWLNNMAYPQMTGDFWNVQDGELLAVTVEGDAMDGAYPDAMRAGDTVLVRLSCAPKDNEMWVIRYRVQDGNWSNWRIRKVSLLGGSIVSLQPYHASFKTVKIPFSDVRFLAKIEYRISECNDRV